MATAGEALMERDPLAQLEAGPIFLVGHMRSGTTWVFDVLTAHPQVAGLFESIIFASVGPLVADRHWDAERHQEIFGRDAGLGQFLDRDEVLRDVRNLVDRWLARALAPEHRFIVEKAPAGANAVATVAKLYPDALIIHIARDGRDVAISTAAARGSWARADYKGEPEPPSSRALWGIGLGWAGQVSQLRQQALTLSLPHHEVRYEEMHAKPKETARQLFDFCGIATDDALLDEILEQTHFSKLPKTGEHSFRRKGQAGGWRQEWGRWERLLFSAAAGEVLEQMGYAPPTPKRAEQLRKTLMRVEKLKGFI
jgi:Sulfotransferase family